MNKRLMRLGIFWLHTIFFVAVIGIGVVNILFGEELNGDIGQFSCLCWRLPQVQLTFY